MISIRVLGPLQVDVDGAAADLGGPRRRAVLARLAVANGRVVPVDRLIDDLYGGEPPPQALAAVQSYVSRLRQAIEPGRRARSDGTVLATSPPGYALRLDHDAVDAWRFERQALSSAAHQAPAVTYANTTALLNLWEGEPYQEFSGMSWADMEATRLGEIRLTVMEQRADAALRLGHAAEQVPELERLTADSPLREQAWRLLALALYQSGRQGDALAALRTARRRLAEELGIDPGPALQRLEADVLAQAPHLLEHPTLRISRGEQHSAGPAGQYVGRGAQLAEFVAAARNAQASRSRIVLVSGEPGAGKTAFADLAGRLLPGDWIVGAGRCQDGDGAPPAWAWTEILWQLAAAVPPADPAALAPMLTETAVAAADLPAGRFRLHRAVLSYLNAVSRARPLLVVVDDLHRADADTLTLVADAAAELHSRPVLILGTYRPADVSEPLAACLARLARHEPARLDLTRLDDQATAELIRACCSQPVTDAVIRVIAARSDGNPFFIREFTRLFDAEGRQAVMSAIPAGVSDVLRHRIARLPDSAQAVLRVAAVAGRQVALAVLIDSAGSAEQTVSDAIEAALRAGLLSEPDQGHVRFVHALVRDVLYEGLSRWRRAKLHARVAAAVERHQPRDVAAIAYHLYASGSHPEQATSYLARVGVSAGRRFARQ